MNLTRAASSIATRIVLIGVAVVVFGTIARYIALGHFLREDVGAVVAAQQLALTGYVAKEVEHKITERREVLENLARAVPPGLLQRPQDKLFLASTHADMVLQPTPPPGVTPLHDQAMQGYRGAGTTMNAQGAKEISAIVTVPSTGWFVVGRIPTAEALVTVGRAQRMGDSVGLLYMDLDKFKPINDRFGHDVGDAVLVKVAQKCIDAISPASDPLHELLGVCLSVGLAVAPTPCKPPPTTPCTWRSSAAAAFTAWPRPSRPAPQSPAHNH